jgi:hypothetical protein
VSGGEELRLVSSVQVNDGQMHTMAVLISDKKIRLRLDNSQDLVAHVKVNLIRFDEGNYFLGGFPGCSVFTHQVSRANFTGIVYSMSLADTKGKKSVVNFGTESTSGINAFEPSGLFVLSN